MAELAQNNLPKAIAMIKGLDIDTTHILLGKLPELHALYEEVNSTVDSGGRVFICGCGATGRLAIVLETLWRQQTSQDFPEWS